MTEIVVLNFLNSELGKTVIKIWIIYGGLAFFTWLSFIKKLFRGKRSISENAGGNVSKIKIKKLNMDYTPYLNGFLYVDMGVVGNRLIKRLLKAKLRSIYLK